MLQLPYQLAKPFTWWTYLINCARSNCYIHSDFGWDAVPTANCQHVVDSDKYCALSSFTIYVWEHCISINFKSFSDSSWWSLFSFFPLYLGTLDAILKMIRYEGFHGFYKGMSTKTVQSVLAAAVLFMIKEELVRVLHFCWPRVALVQGKQGLPEWSLVITFLLLMIVSLM